jgi:AraC-like DNA-binding protein
MDHPKPFEIVFPKSNSPLGCIQSAGVAPNLDGNPLWRTLKLYGLVYIFEGNGMYEDDNDVQKVVGPGSLILLHPGLPQMYPAAKGSDMHQIWMHFKGPIFALLETTGILDPSIPVIELEPVDYWMQKLLQIIGRDTHLLQEEAHLRTLKLCTLLSEAKLHENRKDPNCKFHQWILEARERLEAYCITRNPDWELVAREMGMSYDTFRKKFLARTGVTPSSFRANRQIEIASNLLVHSNLTHAEIADQCGYSDEYHFSKRFKQLTGHSPKTYRSRFDS